MRNKARFFNRKLFLQKNSKNQKKLAGQAVGVCKMIPIVRVDSRKANDDEDDEDGFET